MTIFLIALILAAASYAVTAYLMPKPKIKVPASPVEPFTYHIDEPEFEFDPLAFWLFPDWDSGPPEEPFWMRPLKQPSPSYRIERNYGNVPMFYGRAMVPGKMIVHDKAREARTGVIPLYEPAGSVFDYMLTDEEWDRDNLPAAMRRPPKT